MFNNIGQGELSFNMMFESLSALVDRYLMAVNVIKASAVNGKLDDELMARARYLYSNGRDMIRVLMMDDTPEKTEKIKSVLTGKCMLHESFEYRAKTVPLLIRTVGQAQCLYHRKKMPDKLHEELERVSLLQDGINVPAIHVALGTCGSYVVGDEAFMNKLREEGNRKRKSVPSAK